MAVSYDLLLRGAHVIDPSQGIDDLCDVGICNGRIAGIGRDLDSSGCRDVRDAKGSYVCPGLIDLHGHWYEGGLYGINAKICLDHGVTTAVDAGTTGFANFPEFRRTVIDVSPVNLLAFIHISFLGLHAPFVEELQDLRYARPEETARVIEKHRDRAVGVKIRIGNMTGSHAVEALELALVAARRARVPLMVHISKGAPEREVLRRLRPGDILTHCFHGRDNGLLASDDLGGFIPEVHEARARGVWFDVGHGCGSFSWETATRAFEHHFYPDTISTDLHRYCVDEPLHVTLPEVMSKFLCLGMSLQEVILKTTIAPARALGREEEIGTLRVGVEANLFQFELVTGDFEFTDTHLKVRRGSHRIQPRLVVIHGKPHACGSSPVPLRELYECDEQVLRSIRDTV